jgi:hypothetical protein
MLNRIREIDQLATTIFHVGHFCTRILQQVKPSERAVDVHLWMDFNDFDHAPVAGTNGAMFVSKLSLQDSGPEQAVSSHSQPTPDYHWIDAHASLRDGLTRLASTDWLLVRENDQMIGILTLYDLASPVVSVYLLARLLGMEHGLRRLLGTYSNEMIPDEPSEKGMGDGWSMEQVMNRISSQKSLRSDLGFSSGKKFEREFKRFLRLRNHLAHARSILYVAKDSAEAANIISDLEAFTSRIFELVLNRDAVWVRFEATQIVDAEDPSFIWSGADAAPLPFPSPVFVITAHNPNEKVLSDRENMRRHRLLGSYLGHFSPDKPLLLKEVIGKSIDGPWQETGWAIGGLTRDAAVAIGRHFAQRAVFELTDAEVCVIPMEGCARKALSRRLQCS